MHLGRKMHLRFWIVKIISHLLLLSIQQFLELKPPLPIIEPEVFQLRLSLAFEHPPHLVNIEAALL